VADLSVDKSVGNTKIVALSARGMLVVDLTEIAAEGANVDAALDAVSLHLSPGEEFTLVPGGMLHCRVSRGDAGLVQVTGRLQSRLGLSCGRCLETFELDVDGPIDLVYLPRDRAVSADEDAVDLSDRDMVVAYYDGTQLDLGEMVREQLLLGLSMKQLCREDCRGLCALCGANRNHAACSCPPSESISPLAPLGQLVESKGPTDEQGPVSRTRVRA
jgi:uncharacterized metal-binding protein YceD (DUF177 family)